MPFTEAKSRKLNHHPRTLRRNRLQRLRLQSHDEGLQVVGVQEARGKAGQQWAGHRYVSDTTNAGGHGRALLAPTCMPYALGAKQTYFLKEQHMR
eukprot:3100247-Pyramimonas_sp.AAC.1